MQVWPKHSLSARIQIMIKGLVDKIELKHQLLLTIREEKVCRMREALIFRLL